ncbi:SET domain-containing protein-lysine N-methyltransferase [Candidatus Wolfebacteria bacterium]|nr:SET domain-containing protein-lysine N-methyltransferase [Candidatus Wolfebacteria bacterium]
MEENIYYKETNNYGKSIFAKRKFNQGETVFVISGPIAKNPTIYTIPVDTDLFIDPLPPGKFLNHSCKPSCGIKNRTEVVAMRDLEKDEEITIDYAMIVLDYDQTRLKQDLVCKCGSKICRGKLGSYENLPEELKRRYAGFISNYLLK